MPSDSHHSGTLQIDVACDGDTARVTFTGELDLAGIESARAKLTEAEAYGATELVIDLRELTFIDSSGISFLLGRVQQTGERMTFVPSEAPGVRRVLSMTGVDDVFGGGDESAAAGTV